MFSLFFLLYHLPLKRAPHICERRAPPSLHSVGPSPSTTFHPLTDQTPQGEGASLQNEREKRERKEGLFLPVWAWKREQRPLTFPFDREARGLRRVSCVSSPFLFPVSFWFSKNTPKKDTRKAAWAEKSQSRTAALPRRWPGSIRAARRPDRRPLERPPPPSLAPERPPLPSEAPVGKFPPSVVPAGNFPLLPNPI
jgi:hypothetical protein